MFAGVQSPTGDHCCGRGSPFRQRGRCSYGGYRSWIYELVARERDAAFEPRSRRPKTSPRALPASTIELTVQPRRRLSAESFDAGPDSIGSFLEHHHRPARSSVSGRPRHRRHHGPRASAPTDNGMVFTTRLAGGRGGTQRPRGARRPEPSRWRTPLPQVRPRTGAVATWPGVARGWLGNTTSPAALNNRRNDLSPNGPRRRAIARWGRPRCGVLRVARCGPSPTP